MTEEDRLQQTQAALDPAAFAWLASRGRWKIAPHLELLDEKLLDVAEGKCKRLLIQMPPRHGKALALDTPIPTPSGWTPMGELKVGDQVFGADGSVCEVTGVSPVFRNRQAWRVIADDGTEVVADEEHLWRARLCGKRPSFKLHTTEKIGRPRAKRAMVETQGALQLPDADLPIDPYLLGIWLGDGHSKSSHITAEQEDGEHYVRTLADRGCTETMVRVGARMMWLVRGLQVRLRALGVLGDKHIPVAYLRGGEGQRRALLRGLIDTDGYVAPDGQVEFCSTNVLLAEGVRELVQSLGVKAAIILGRATLYGKDCGAKYRVMFYMSGAASLPRKATRCRNGVKTPGRYIVAERAGFADTRCIQVSSQDGMFLCGPGMLPTHNSSLTSAYYPAWYLGTFPDRRVILGSYEHDFAMSWGQKARDILAEWGPHIWGPGVSKERRASDDWQTTGTGGMICAGVGGPITGRGADLLIIDDPVKSAEEANSETYRNRAWDWYRATAYTRLEPGGAVLLIQTRWHEDDLAGRILAHRSEDGEPWEVLTLPALAEGGDLLGREAGKALWPERFDEGALSQIQSQVGSYYFAALYQQRPSPAGGSLFQEEWWRFWTEEPACEEYLLSVDCSYKDGKDSSFTVIQCWGRQGDDLFLLDQWRKQCGFNEAREGVKYMAARWPQAWVKLIEDKANGRAVIESLEAEIGGIQAVEPHGGKYSRAQAVLPSCEGRHVVLPHPTGVSWVSEFIREAKYFPVDKHDDQVDAMTQALARFASGRSSFAEQFRVFV